MYPPALRFRDHILWAIDAILAKPELDETRRTEAVSLKKLLKGDGSWCTRKEILGWIIDTIRQTLELPSHRKQELVELLAGLQAKKRVAFREWQKVLGKLRFIAKATAVNLH